MNKEPGKLYIVATPIGNLEDISYRAISTLQNVDTVLCEDTRRFGILAKKFNIQTPLQSFHEHNETSRIETLIKILSNGKSLALISDAGTPLINDPGFKFVRECRKNNITIESIPGPCAAIAALSISGLEPDTFTFVGFLSPKSGKRKSQLEHILQTPHTSIVYESPHKILKTLEAINELAPERELFIARELTKIHEESLSGTSDTLLKHFTAKEPKGEFVLIIKGKDK